MKYISRNPVSKTTYLRRRTKARRKDGRGGVVSLLTYTIYVQTAINLMTLLRTTALYCSRTVLCME